jgi:hypothetical protein
MSASFTPSAAIPYQLMLTTACYCLLLLLLSQVTDHHR